MSKRLLVRADDLGFSEAVNYGIERTLHTGIVRSVGVMANMPAAEHGVRLLSGHDVAVGLHACISAGEPLSDSSLVPSLVESTGQFHGSAAYRAVEEDFVSFEEAYREIRLQVDQLKSLLGRLPDYIDIHAVLSPSFMRAAAAVAEELGLPTSTYRFVDSLAALGEAIGVIGVPCVVKPVMSSSGKGQSVVRSAADAADAWSAAMEGARAAKARAC